MSVEGVPPVPLKIRVYGRKGSWHGSAIRFPAPMISNEPVFRKIAPKMSQVENSSPDGLETKPAQEGTVVKALALGDRIPPSGLVLFSIVSIQLGSVVAVSLFGELGPIGAVLFRLGLAGALLLCFVRRSAYADLLQHWKIVLLLGTLIAGLNGFFFIAIDRLPLGTAVAIEFLGPLGVAVLTSRRWIEFLWVGLAAAGLAILTPSIGDDLDAVGVAFAFAAAVSWGGFILASKRVGQIMPGSSGLAFAMVVAAILTIPFGFQELQNASFTWEILGLALLMAILSTAIPFSFEYKALKKIPARTYGILIALEPAVAGLFGSLFLADELSARALVAITAVTLAAFGNAYFQNRL